ncbi:MAG: hypothetical protein AB9866_24530 [Syntrophobacteraceae bacterium]
MTKRKKGSENTSDGEQYARFVEAAEKLGPYDESVLDEVLKKIASVKPERKKRKIEGNYKTE